MEWLRLIEAPTARPTPAARVAWGFRSRPDAIFLLSDGEYPDGTAEAIAKRNVRKIPIHCIDLSGGEGGDQLQRIAAR